MIAKLIMYNGMLQENCLPESLEDEYDEAIDARWGLSYAHNRILNLLIGDEEYKVLTNSYYVWVKLSPFVDSYIYENGEIIPARDILYEGVKYVEDEDIYIKYLGPKV